jgi:molybdopterin-containing oxidoreductase family iron-sulfur binding subunit
MTGCPYGVRQFNWQTSDKSFERAFEKAGFPENSYAEKNYQHGYPVEHRTKDDRLVYTPKRPRGVVEKCTFCVQYIDQGLQPACVRACPGNARIFGDLDDPQSEISRVIRTTGVFRLNEELGTSPKVFYIPPTRKAGKGEVSYEKTLKS